MTAAEMLEEELKTFEQNKSDLLATANGKFALIHDSKVEGTYSSEQDAIAQGYRTFGNVPFLVRRIAELPGDFRVRLSSIEATEVTRELTGEPTGFTQELGLIWR